MEEDSRFAVTSFPPCGEWGSVDDVQQAWPESPCTSSILTDIWSPQQKPVQVKAKRTRIREESLCRCCPFLILGPQASRQLLSGNKCWGRQDPHAPWTVFLRISFCWVQKSAFLITQWRVLQELLLKLQLTLASQRTSRAKRCMRSCLSVCFTLQLLLPWIGTVAELKN